ncbi:hypothetical protein BHE74_00013769 [Ensete ventricosum]|nr:hypothetical protein BHE74_00013769 [Ensete ventricosum]
MTRLDDTGLLRGREDAPIVRPVREEPREQNDRCKPHHEKEEPRPRPETHPKCRSRVEPPSERRGCVVGRRVRESRAGRSRVTPGRGRVRPGGRRGEGLTAHPSPGRREYAVGIGGEEEPDQDDSGRRLLEPIQGLEHGAQHHVQGSSLLLVAGGGGLRPRSASEGEPDGVPRSDERELGSRRLKERIPSEEALRPALGRLSNDGDGF